MEDIFDFVSNQKVDQDDENLSCKMSNVVFRLIICNIFMNLIHTVKFYVVIGIIFVLCFTMNKNIYGENIKEYIS